MSRKIPNSVQVSTEVVDSSYVESQNEGKIGASTRQEFKKVESIKVELEEDAAPPVSVIKLFKYADNWDRLLILFGIIFAMANGAVMPLFSIILGDLFDRFGQEAPPGDDNFYRNQASETSKLFAYLGVGAFVAAFIQMCSLTIAAERQVLRIRQLYLASVLDQEIAWFDQRQSGELSSKISENTVVIKEAIGDKFGSLFQFSAMFVVGFVVGFYYSWKLTLVICAVTPLLALGGFLMMSALGELTSNGLASYAKAGSIVEETLSNIRTVTAFSAQKRIVEKYDTHLVAAEKAGIAKSLRLGMSLGFVIFIMLCSYSLAFFYGAILIEQDRNDFFEEFSSISLECSALATEFGLSEADFCGSATVLVPIGIALNFTADPLLSCDCGCSHPDADCLTGGDVILVFFSVLMGSFALGQAAPNVSTLRNGQISAGKIFSILEREPQIKTDLDGDDLEKPTGGVVKNVGDEVHFSGEIVLENVEFAYPTRSEVKVLQGISLTIPKGKSTALVGGSGCGKSTVMALIQRFYDPDSGTVWILDENNRQHDLRLLDLAHFRNNIGLVSQEPVLFATTIAKNIAYGAPIGHTPTLEDIERAAKSANAFDFISGFPEGFHTMVGERGAQLSGGQKQRIAIARAILRNPTFLLLDEATSALDNESERVVQKALDKLLEDTNRTTVVIAHRLSTIRKCDKIIVLGGGKVLEEGNHESLLALENGTYNMLVNAANQTQERANRKNAKENRNDIEVEVDETKKGSDSEKDKSNEEVKGEAEEEKKVGFGRIFGLAKPEWKWFVPAIIGAAVNGAQTPVFSVIFADISTALFNVDSEEVKSEANKFALMFLGLAVAAGLANLSQFYCFGFIAEKLTRRVRLLLFTTMLKQEIGFFDEAENSVGALASSLATDAALVKANIADRLGITVQNTATVVAGLGIAFVNGWQLTLVLLACVPIIMLSGGLQLVALLLIMRSDDKFLKPASQVLQESIAGIRTVTAFNAKSRIVALYRGYLEVPMKLGTRKGLVIGLSFGFSQALIFGLDAIAFYIGAYFIDLGIFDFNQMITVFFAVVMTAMGLGQAAGLAPDIAKGSVAVKSVFKLVDRKSKIDPTNPDGVRELKSPEVSLKFSSIDFVYPARPQVQIFNDFTLQVPPGSTVALVGSSGSGKSTVVSLLQRFYDPVEGSIRIADEFELKDANIEWWRSQIALVEQEPKLFAMTIKENIEFGITEQVTQDVRDEMVVEAAKSANAHDFIMEFPDGYETKVGDQGAQLSGGQKQRICIARAIIRKPRVLLLDEATSALDNKSEKVVQAALDNLLQSGSMTTVIVAHRLTTIKDADMIVVLAHGKVLEIGKHDQLLNLNGSYAKLWNSQLEQH